MPYAGSRVDETAIAGPAVSFLSGTLRPPDFMYPTGFLYAVALLYAGWFAVTFPFGWYASLAALADRRYETVAPFFYLSRGLSAVMGTLTVWWVFAICRRVFDETIAIVAALFMALAYLHVRDSHFGTTDVSMTALVVLAVLAIVRWQEDPVPWRAAMAGLIGGFAASTKYNGFGVCVPFAVAAAQRAFGRDSSDVKRTLWATIIFASGMALGFLATSPYVLLEWPRFVRDVNAQRTTLALGNGLVLSRGWWHHAHVTLPAALGWPLYAAGVGGMAVFVARGRQTATILAFPLAYYLVAGSGYRVFARDIIPLLPFLCIAGAWLTVKVAERITATRPALRPWVIAAAAAVIVAPSARNVILLDRIFLKADNRVVVAKALPAIVAAGSLIYQSGESYGRVPLYLAGPPPFKIESCEYDEGTGRFTSDGRLPDWIILQHSPLSLYSRVPAGITQIVAARYELIRHYGVANDDRSRTYDQQDAFFLPLAGLAGIERIGPAFDLYRLRTPG